MGIKNKEAFIIDDYPVTRTLISKILETAGMTPIEAGSLPEALEILTIRSPHIIITDLRMPQISGFVLLEQKNKFKALANLPIIVLSSLSDKASIMKALSLGASDYLVKPLNATMLLRKIRKALMDDNYKEYVFPEGLAPKVEIKVSATITDIGETGFLLEAPIKLSPETNLEIQSKLIKELELENIKMKTTKKTGRLNSKSGQFYNNVIFVGVTEKLAQKIRSFISAKKTGNR